MPQAREQHLQVPGTEAASLPPSHSGCHHHGEHQQAFAIFGQHRLEGLLLILEPRPRFAGVWAGARAWGILGRSPAPFVSVFLPSAPQRTTANPDLQMGKLRLSEARSPGQGETTKKWQSRSESRRLCFPLSQASHRAQHVRPWASNFISLASVFCNTFCKMGE